MANENVGKRWSEDEIKKLGKLADGNTPTRIIAMKLGRTPDAVRNKASQESISLQLRTNLPMTVM